TTRRRWKSRTACTGSPCRSPVCRSSSRFAGTGSARPIPSPRRSSSPSSPRAVGLFDKITQGLRKTRDAFTGGITSVLRPGRKLEPADYDALESALLRADVGPSTTDRILEDVKSRLGEGSFRGEPADALRESIQTLLEKSTAVRGTATGSVRPRP